MTTDSPSGSETIPNRLSCFLGFVGKATDPPSRPTYPALIIGPYLAAQTLILSVVALLTWLAADWDQWFKLMRWLPAQKPELLPEKFRTFQIVIVSACAAGLGGTVFMIRDFYQKFAFGFDREEETKEGKKKYKEFLGAKDIPRFILLPFSSVILGPISYALAKTGAIAFAGLSAAGGVQMHTAVVLGFLLGFGYHDTLNALRELCRRILSVKPGGSA